MWVTNTLPLSLEGQGQKVLKHDFGNFFQPLSYTTQHKTVLIIVPLNLDKHHSWLWCSRMEGRGRHKQTYRPFEEDEVEVVVVFRQHVADDARRVAGADLIAWQDEVDTLREVPQLSRNVVSERPKHQHTAYISNSTCIHSVSCRSHNKYLPPTSLLVQCPVWISNVPKQNHRVRTNYDSTSILRNLFLRIPRSYCHNNYASMHARTHAHTHTTISQLSGFCPGQPGRAGPRRNIHPLTPIVVINHPLSASSIYYDPWHPLCSIYVPDSLFSQSLSKFSLVYLLAYRK